MLVNTGMFSCIFMIFKYQKTDAEYDDLISQKIKEDKLETKAFEIH